MYLDEKRQGEAPVVSRAAQLLLAAADILSEPGIWVNSIPSGRHHCVLTAIAFHVKPDDRNHQRAAKDAIERVAGMTFPYWNDVPGRTLDEVLNLLRKTAKIV